MLGSRYSISRLLSLEDCLTIQLRYYVRSESLTLIGKPSAALASKIDTDEKKRLADRRAELGEAKLKELERELENAKAESDKPPPAEMIGDFPLTDVRRRPSGNSDIRSRKA